MNEEKYQVYKSAKNIDEQLDYLHDKKRVQYNDMDRETAGEKLLEYNYINVITPFKHRFAKKDTKMQLIKSDKGYIYEEKVEFSEYYELFLEERNRYSVIISNIQYFELHFKSITAYFILTSYMINDSNQLKEFLMSLKSKLSLLENRYTYKRIQHMSNQLDHLANDIFRHADVYCFFDRMSLGDLLTIYTCLDNNTQNSIFCCLKKYGLNYNVNKVSDFIKKIFCLVSIRNCVMHCNSLEILIRYYNPRKHILRKNHNKQKYIKMIELLSKEKPHGKMP